MTKLLLTAQDGSSREIPSDRGSFSIGRGAGNDLSYPDDIGLSRQHLLLERQDGEWCVRDLGSKNGTFVNNIRVNTPRVLQPGDKLVASRVTISCENDQAPLRTVVFEAPSPQGLSRTNLRISLQEALLREATTPFHALIRAGRELAIRRPLPELAQVILNLALEAVSADRGVVLTIEGGKLVEQASRGDSFRISTMVRDRVIQERESLLIQNVLSEEVLQKRHSIVFGGVQSLMAVPLQTDERVIGLLYVDSVRLMSPFTQESLSLLTVMANVVAIRLEQERFALMEEKERFHAMELEQAAEIQRNHLPAEAPSIPGYDIAGGQWPSRTVGGDYFDFVHFPNGQHGMVVADVAGKGLPASLLMMKLQAHVQALAEASPGPMEFVTRLNRSITATCPRNRFITFFLAEIDPASGALRYTNAGHNPPLLLHADGTATRLTEGGPVLGLLARAPYREAAVQLARGDLLLLYSDGISEAENAAGEEFGDQRILDVVRSLRYQNAEQIIAGLHHAVEVFTEGAPASDDRTLVAVRVLH